MPSVIQPAEFFVVGGPVQADRACYVERAADRLLDDALRAKRLCCVLGPLAIGKTSLLNRAARTLRAAGTLLASIDLKRIAEQGSATADAALKLIAQRIAADLKLRVDVGAWWNARDVVDEHRLVDFFWEVVLTNTTAPIVVLVDDIDAALALPFAADLLDAIGGCYSRRTRDRDFTRLGFVLAGCASRRALEQVSSGAGFAHAELIEPEDFTAEQSYRLAPAFGGERELAQALMDRVCAWTSGHPYLTQRVARGTARKGGRLEDVERVVREQLLSPEAANRDPLLAQIRASFADPSRSSRRAAKLLRKLAHGGSAPATDTAVAERLWLSGTVRVDAQMQLRVRNRIVKELVAMGWLATGRGASKWLAAAAVLLLAVAGGGYWYTQRLPVSDIATLSDPAASPDAAEASYRRLRGLPGFEERADELWLAALGRQSRAAATLTDAAAADTRLRELPGQAAAADRLLSEFWLRRARERAHAEQRDAAILLAQRAASRPGADPAAAAFLAELAADDYSRLERTLPLSNAPAYWHMSFPRGVVVSIDDERHGLRTALAGSATPAATAPLVLTALAHSALTRELAVDGDGTAGELTLSLAVAHPSTDELLVTLTAPSGAVAAVAVPRSASSAVETFELRAVRGSPLAALADEGMRGTWRLTVVDREAGNSGLFGGWGIAFGATLARDDLTEPVPIPDPLRSEEVVVLAAAERAVAWPSAPGVVGTVAVWNLATGQLERDLALPSPPSEVALDPTGTRVLAATDRLLLLWNAEDGALTARVGTETGFVLPPVFSADGGYVAIAERVEGGNPLYSVLRSADGSLVGTIEGAPDVQRWELGPGGRYVALLGPETVVRILETGRGAELKRLPHSHAVERLLHSSDGAAVVTVDGAGAIAVWPLALASAGLGRPLGRTVAAASVSASGDGRRIAFTREDGAVSIVDVTVGAELYRLRVPRAVPVTTTQLSADGGALVTQSGAELKSWLLPPKPVTPRGAGVDSAPTALALDPANGVVAVGFASGQLQILPSGTAPGRPSLSFFGHRGAITAAALAAERGLAATGGNDGIVRVWDLATSAPTGAVAQPADEPVTIVALSADGRYVASAAGNTVRAATVADGRVLAEVAASGPVTALAFSPDAARIAVGDATGGVVIAALAENARERSSLSLRAAATSLAFSPDGSRLAAADAAGGITLAATASARVEAAVRHWSQPIRWLEQSADGSALLVATDAWLHALAPIADLPPVQSKLVQWPASSTVLRAVSATEVSFAGADAGGALVAGHIDLAAASAVPSDASALVARDWSTALALRLNDNGDPVPLDR